MEVKVSDIKPEIFLRVSSLSHMEYCPKRAKIECFTKISRVFRPDNSINRAMLEGTRLHKNYSYLNREFDRDTLVNNLMPNTEVYTKQVDNIQIRGAYDDLRIYTYHGKKYTSLIELKTTARGFWNREINSAIRQTELYMWLLKEKLESLKFPLWKRSYVEIYSQKDGMLITRIPVEYNYDIEEWIRDVVNQFKGLNKMIVPHYAYCKRCPTQVRSKCDWYYLRKGSNNG